MTKPDKKEVFSVRVDRASMTLFTQKLSEIGMNKSVFMQMCIKAFNEDRLNIKMSDQNVKLFEK